MNYLSIKAAAMALPDAQTAAPEWIMFLPGGVQKATASVDGSGESREYVITAATAKRLNDSLQAVRAAGQPEPYFAFDHNQIGPASAWPQEFRWMGEVEGKAPGVYTRVKWTPAGMDAVTVKGAGQLPAYRYFSPGFRINRKTNEVMAIDLPEAGSLVNDPAFREIAKVAAKNVSAPADETQNNERMKKEAIADAAVAALGLTPEEAAGENAAAFVTSKVSALRADASVKASRDSELSTVKARLTEATTELETLRKERADEAVEAAVKAGKLLPKDADTQEFWRGSLTSNYTASVKALNALPRVVPAESGAKDAGAKDTVAEKDEAAESARYQRVKAKAHQLKRNAPAGTSFGDCFAEAERTTP